MASISKSQQLVSYLRDAIQSGRWSVGDRLPGEHEFGAEFRVSRTTVRDALALLEKDGLIVRKNGIGTFVAEKNTEACVLITANAGRVSSLMGYWFRVLIEEAQAHIAKSGFRPILAVGHGETDEEFMSSLNISTEATNCEIAGAIDLSFRPALQQHIASKGIPLVQVESALATCTYAVVLDYAKVMQIAVDEMNRCGHSDFALMAYGFSEKEREHITCGECDRLVRVAVNYSDDRLVWVPGHPDASLAYDVFKEWWSKPDRPNAIYFFDDSLFDVASRAILELGIKVPEELAIMTHANVGRPIHFPTRLSRIGFDPAVVMGLAWTMLNKLICREQVFDSVVKASPVYVQGDSLSRRWLSDASDTQDVALEGGDALTIASK